MRRPLQPTENGPETFTSKRSTKKKQKNADTQRKEERRYDEGNLGRGKGARHESAPPTFLARNKEWVVGAEERWG